MSSSDETFDLPMSVANELMNRYLEFGPLLDEYDAPPDAEHLGQAQKRRNLERMIDSFVEDNIKTVRDAGNKVDTLIGRDKFTEWMEEAYL